MNRDVLASVNRRLLGKALREREAVLLWNGPTSEIVYMRDLTKEKYQ